MTTESSAVSDLIRLTTTRRLQTDPADGVLFRSSASSSRGSHSWEPPPVTNDTSTSTRTRPAYPRAPSKGRSWPIILSMLVAGGLGIAIAAYYNVGEETAPSTTAIQMPTFAPPPPPAPAPPPAVVAPAPSVPAAAPAIPESPPAATAEAPVAAPIAAPAPVVKHATKRVAKKRAKARSVVTPAPPAPPAPPAQISSAPSPSSPPAVKPQRAMQADDHENPLR